MPQPQKSPWIRYQDIQIPDVNTRQQFDTYTIGGNFAKALELLEASEQQLKGKAYIANLINVMTSAVTVLEGHYIKGVPMFLSDLAKMWYKLIADMKDAGHYSNTATYEPNNFVEFNKLIYLALEQTQGVDPTHQYPDGPWLEIGLRGIQGVPGNDLIVRYEWNGGTQYAINDIVTRDGDIYVALKGNIGIEPGTDETVWTMFLKFTKGEITVGPSYGPKPIQDCIWFKTKTDPKIATTEDPIYGQFLRYNAEPGIWEEMYPRTVFTLISNRDDYAKPLVYDEFQIAPSDWVQGKFTYTNPAIAIAGMVNFMPQLTTTPQQQYYYNLLSLEIQDDKAIFTISELPTTETISLRAIIQ